MIRSATSGDVPAIRRLMESEPGFWHPDWSDDSVGRAIENAGELAVVWEESSDLAGFLCCHDLGFRGYLSALIVAPGARGRGIGRQLLEHTRTELSRRGRHVLIADVWRDAVPFYRSLGWTPPDVVLLKSDIAAR